MGAPRIPEEVVNRIGQIWFRDRKQSASDVLERYKSERGGRIEIQIRKVQQIIADLRLRVREGEFPRVPWLPWNAGDQTPAEHDYLLRLDAISRVLFNRHLYDHEAVWARRLMVGLESLSPREQLLFAMDYATREEQAFFLDESIPYTTDLDGVVAYKPWQPDNQQAYEYALVTGMVAEPAGSSQLRERLESTSWYVEHPEQEADEHYRGLPTVWDMIAPQLNIIRPSEVHVNRGLSEVKARMLDGLAVFWGKKPPVNESGTEQSEGNENHERLDQTQQQR